MTDGAGGDEDGRKLGVGLRVLVVEDTRTVAELIRRALERDGMTVDLVGTLAGARNRLAGSFPDVVVLDVELPDGSGLDLLREPLDAILVPVVVLSGRQTEDDRMLGLDLGAEDYMVKPFFPRELATRVRRAAARPAARDRARGKLDFGDLVLNPASRETWVSGECVDLTDREFDLLAHMAASPGTVFHRDDLLREVWRSSPEWQTSKTVTEHIRRIRSKVEADPARPRWITTVGRMGYRFDRHGGSHGLSDG